MRICIVNTIRAYGGGEKWILRAAALLQQRGCEVTVLGDPLSELGKRCIAAQQRFHPTALNDRSLFSAAGELRRALAADRPDAVICCNERAVRVAALTRAISPAAGGFIPIVYRNGLEGSFKNKLLNRLLVGPRVACFVANAEGTRQEMLGFGWIPPSACRVIYNGVEVSSLEVPDRDAIRRELGVSDNDVLALAAARLVPVKGHALLLEAWSRLPPHQRPQLRIAGDGPEAANLEHQVTELGLTPWVRLLGFRTDVARLLQAADVLCHPSRREGAPNIVLEAMAAALPVIGLAASGTTELVEHGTTGLLTPVEDPAALARSVESLAGAPSLRRSMGDAGKRRALAEFSEENSADRWLALLSEVVSAASGRIQR